MKPHLALLNISARVSYTEPAARHLRKWGDESTAYTLPEALVTVVVNHAAIANLVDRARRNRTHRARSGPVSVKVTPTTK